ncbi:vacuolar iron transporter (VIT) family protein [Actinidia rufa]|uniref:Vacuolar iron transporter n=1 Tax=Actinidia rufa TaxID=165716 RepID=A0A7J0ESK5_9ERIC|nr:vacuolar iron transporter (VIT) family protein [Actinidia rufa]
MTPLMMSIFLSQSLKLSKIAKNMMKPSSTTLKGRNGSEQLCWEPTTGLVAGACSMAIGEFVSVYSQLDIEAAIASALAFTLGAIVPLLAAAFIRDHKVRLGVVVVAVSVALVVFGGVGAVLGRTPVVKSGTRVVVGGWMAMAITYGLTKLIGSSGLQM